MHDVVRGDDGVGARFVVAHDAVLFRWNIHVVGSVTLPALDEMEVKPAGLEVAVDQAAVGLAIDRVHQRHGIRVGVLRGDGLGHRRC